MSGKVWWILLSAVIASSGSLAAQEFDLGEFVVTSTRTRTAVLEAPGHVTVITAGEIEETGAGSVAEVLGRQTGLLVGDYGAAGALKTIKIRGSESAQVLVLLNGMRLNDARSGGVDLSMVPLDGIERIEIVRGGLSAVHGADAVGGVINIVTKRQSEDHIRLQVENGGYLPHRAVQVAEGGTESSVEANPLDLLDTQRIRLEVSRSLGPSDLVAAGSFTRAANEFVWYDDRYIDDFRRRTNADLLGGDLYLGWSLPFVEGVWGATGLFAWQEKGSPGTIDPIGFSLSTDARQTQTSFSGQVQYEAERFLADLLSLDARFSYRYDQLDYLDPPSSDRHSTHALALEAAQEWFASDLLSAIYGGNLALDLADSTLVGEKQRLSGGVFLELLIAPVPGLTITPAVRYDYYSDFPGSLNGRLSAVYRLSRTASLKTSLATSYRAPTFNELYWPVDAWGTRGNPNLRPETGYSGDFGVSWLGERLELDAFIFARYMFDMIDWGEYEPWKYEPTNIHEAFYPGAELALGLKLFESLRVSAGYTLNYSFVLDGYTFADDRRVANVPVHTANAGVEYRNQRNLARLDAQYTGRRYKEAANTTVVDPYLLLNARYRRALGDRVALSLSVRNLLNQAAQALDGYILPPISLWTGVEVTF